MIGRDAFTRRRFVTGAGGVAAAAVLAGVVFDHSATGLAVPLAGLPAEVPGLPGSQHAWNATLKLDEHGNHLPPRYDTLLFFRVRGKPEASYARLLEAELRKLEHAHVWGPGGLLFTVGWSSNYFTGVLGVKSPIPAAQSLSDFEWPTLDPYDVCVHLASDDQSLLTSCAAGLKRGLASIMLLRATRTGFTGAGLPASHQQVIGIPPGRPVSESAPLYMGFKSALKKNQATEAAVTIPGGDFAQGTTMAVSYMTLSLNSWYQDLNDAQRVGLMYSPQTTVRDAAAFTTEAESNPALLKQAIKRGVIGHSQASARARRDNQPIILRRDFDTVDGGQAGVHFVSLQRSIADFVATRTAMNQQGAGLQNPAISMTVNNGINAFIFVQNRANYIVPARAQRSFPLLPERERML